MDETTMTVNRKVKDDEVKARENETDDRLIKAGVPQSAIDRMCPELSGGVVWNPDTFCFEIIKQPSVGV